MQKNISVIDINSKNIVAAIGSVGTAKNLFVKTSVKVGHSGYCDGEFIDLDNFKIKLSEVIDKIETTTGKNFSSAFVGISSQFCTFHTAVAELSFDTKKPLNARMIDNLCDIAQKTISHKLDNEELINRMPIYFLLDQNTVTTSVRGKKASSIEAMFCFVFAKKDFLFRLTKIFSQVGIYKIDFIASVLAKCIYLLSQEIRKNDCILLDIGYVCTSVNLVHGDGIINNINYSSGSGHILGDLYNVFGQDKSGLNFNEIVKLTEKITLSVDKSANEVYTISSGQKIVPLSAKAVHDIVKSRIENLASSINKAMGQFALDKSNVVYLANSDFVKIKGAVDYLSKCLGRQVVVASSPNFNLRTGEYTGALSLLNFGVELKKVQK